MSGRIKLLENGVPINPTEDPPLGYEYQTVDNEFDQACGTWGLSPFQLPNNQCPERFVCLGDDFDSQVARVESSMPFADFASCIDAMNCHMMAGMTTGASSGSEAVLFIHQMIPHHQNAVNMAKVLLKANTLRCEDLISEEPHCILEKVIRSIIVDQNHQIQLMRGYLEALGYDEHDDCVIEVDSTAGTLIGASASMDEGTNTMDDATNTNGASGASVISLIVSAIACSMVGATSLLW